MKTLGAADAVLRAYPNAAYVMFKQPAVSEGRLLYNFRSVAAQNYTAVDYSKDQFYLSGTSAKNLYLDSVFFLPAADCSTQIRLAFTVYGTSGTQLGSGELTVRSKDIPIQQTIELPGAAEDDAPLVRGEVLACVLSAAESTGGAGEASLSVTWKLRIEVWRAVQYRVAADAYSTLCKTQTVQTPCRLLQKTADLSGRISVSIEDDLPDAEGTVIGCFVTLGAACAVPADGERAEAHLRLQGKGTAHVLIGDARGELTCYDKTFLWQPDGVWPGTADAAWPSMGAAAVRVVSSKSGARLRVDLEIETSGILMQAANTDALCDVELGEAYDDADGPALYIYYARQGERIFDIAKRYHARARDLAAANHLDTTDKPPQELTTEAACLLIPAAL